MIGPVSGTGRAMMASLQQAVEKGMPPDQAVQYVKSMATQGVAPLTDLYSMMNQFQRLKQQQVQPPQTPPTIKDQLNMLDQQQGRQGGIAGLQAPAPQGEPMDRGLGAIDAGRMEYPQFAGGGIVAFDQGGGVEDEEPGFLSRLAAGFAGGMGGGASAQPFLTGPERRLGPLGEVLADQSDEDLASALANAVMSGDKQAANELTVVLRQRNRGELINKVNAEVKKQSTQARAAQLGFAPPGAQAATAVEKEMPSPVVRPAANILADTRITPPPAEKDITEEQYKKLQDFRTREGIGKAREEMSQFLTSEERRLEKAYGEDRRLAFAEAGFRMAQAASRPGATFLGALSEGAISGTQALKGINKELAENRRLLKQSMIKLREAAELEKEGDYKTAMGLNKEARAETLKLYEIRENLKSDRMKIASMDRQTEASREYTQMSRDEAANTRKAQLRERILENSMYPTLQMRLQSVDPEDTETQQKIQAQMNAIMRDATIRAGLPEEAAMISSGFATPTRFRFDVPTGRMIPIG
jgi:hypothetical protein